MKHLESDKNLLASCELTDNPFPAAAAGIDIERVDKLYIPESWKGRIDDYISFLSNGRGPKAFPIIGKYGSGKTVLLKYLKGYLVGVNTSYPISFGKYRVNTSYPLLICAPLNASFVMRYGY